MKLDTFSCKLFCSIVAASFALSCTAVKQVNNPPFKITEASYFYWNGGQPGVSGININLRYTTSQEVSFDSIYFRDMKGAIELHKDDRGALMIGRINTSKTLDVISVDSNFGSEGATAKKRTMVSQNADLKDDEALILYTFKNEKCYFKVLGLSEKKPKFYK